MSRRAQKKVEPDSESSHSDEEVITTTTKKTTKVEEKRAVAGSTVVSTGQTQDFACWHCDTTLYGHRFVNREGHPYCVKCYNELFANKCEKCRDIISVDNKDLAFKERHWHDHCFKCHDCQNSLVNTNFGSRDEKLYCGNCWDLNFAPKCDKCHDPFRAGSMKLSWNDGEWHKDCFSCSNCDEVIGQEAFHPQDQKPYCERCWENIFAIKCTKCKDPIRAGGVTYRLEPYHRECFTCSECSNSLAGQRFTLNDNKPICSECFGSSYAYKCADCRQAITGIGGNRYIIFEDRQWHCECFFCRSCNASLVGVNFVAEGYGKDLEIYCQPCGFQKRGWDFTNAGGIEDQKSQKVADKKSAKDEPSSRGSKRSEGRKR